MPSISVTFCWSYAPFELQTLTIMQFSAFFSYMLWHIELKSCIWLYFTLLQIKFECHQFASIFVGVMPLLVLRILEIQFSALFSSILWHIELKFYIWLCLTVLQIKLECRQFASIFVEVMHLLGLRILEIHSFPHFSLTCIDILSWNFSYDLVKCTIDQVRVSSLCVRLALHPSIYFLHFPPTCIDKFSWNLKCDVAFFNAFPFRKVLYIKKPFVNVHDGRIMHRLRCSCIFCFVALIPFGLFYTDRSSFKMFQILHIIVYGFDLLIG